MKRRKDQTRARKAYESPKVEYFGPVTITAMPGGSAGIEGNSGKTHPFATGNDENIHG